MLERAKDNGRKLKSCFTKIFTLGLQCFCDGANIGPSLELKTRPRLHPNALVCLWSITGFNRYFKFSFYVKLFLQQYIIFEVFIMLSRFLSKSTKCWSSYILVSPNDRSRLTMWIKGVCLDQTLLMVLKL